MGGRHTACACYLESGRHTACACYLESGRHTACACYLESGRHTACACYSESGRHTACACYLTDSRGPLSSRSILGDNVWFCEIPSREGEKMTMPLLEAKIKQAILHPEEEVRLTALGYFAGSQTADETIMPLVIEAVEKYGWRQAFRLLRDGDDLPQTVATVAWLSRRVVQGLGFRGCGCRQLHHGGRPDPFAGPGGSLAAGDGRSARLPRGARNGVSPAAGDAVLGLGDRLGGAGGPGTRRLPGRALSGPGYAGRATDRRVLGPASRSRAA